MVTEVDPGRWAMETFRHPSKKHRGTSYTFASGTLGDVSGFDADFFAISPREAAQMDPQQRLLLEMTWEALENSGVRPSEIRGSKCGVYIGISSADYSMRFADDFGAVDSMTATGNTSSIAANRISYVFDLKGPSMAIDTACSSSLVAFHQACQSISSGEIDMAICGGVSLLLHPFGFIAFSKASMLSRQGICNVFDAAGDGYVRSEGGGVFFLKDYEQALADGDPIVAVVAGSAVNSDGKKSGLTVPSNSAQAALLVEAYAKAGISPSEVAYIEAHGTGTPVGDPIETRALSNALGQLRPKGDPLLIGSIKSNLGHLEAASGVAGLVKALHCVKYRTVPATIHLQNPNPNIPFQDWNLKVVTQNTQLANTGRIVVGINSFGFGGTNAHVILESHSAKVSVLRPKASKELAPGRIPLVLSGKSESALKAVARDMATVLRKKEDVDLYDIAYQSAFKRDWHPHRAVAFGGTPHAVANALENFADGKHGNHVVTAAAGLTPTPSVAFIYSGNGSQWEGMGRRLLLESPIFKAAVQAVEQEFEKYDAFSLKEELFGLNGSGRYDRTEIAQPALFAIQVGLTEMLRSDGIAPTVVAGHSVGEVAAAWAAGALTLEQAVMVIYHRSHHQGRTKGAGQMTAIALGEADTRAILNNAGLADVVAIAGINSGRGVTVAGPIADLTALESVLKARKVVFKRLDLDYAFHSAAMDPIQVDLAQSLKLLVPGKSHIDFVSTVSGDVTPGTQLDANYWWRNIREPVLFEKAVGTIRSSGIDVFVEIGPHAVLLGYINECLKSDPKPGRTIPTLARGDDAPQRVWTAAAQVMLTGAKVDLTRFFPYAGRFTVLPTYPWQRERHWQSATQDSHNLLQRRKVHPLLGYPIAQQDLAWENQIDAVLYPQLADHMVGGSIVFPGAGYAELGLAAASQWADDQKTPTLLELEELEIKMFLVLSADRTKLMRVFLDPSDGSFRILTRDEFSTDAWTLHANGRVLSEPQEVLFEQERAQLPVRPCDFDGDAHVRLTQTVDLAYGPAFQAIESGWIAQNTVWARLKLPECIAATLPQSLLHPALLDCSFQLVFHLLPDQLIAPSGVAYLPTKIGRLSLRTGMGVPAIAKAQLVNQSPHSLTAHFTIFNSSGEVIAWLREVRFRSVPLRRQGSASLDLLTYSAVASARAGCNSNNVEALFDRLSQDLPVAARAFDDAVHTQVYSQQVEPLLDALCLSYAVEAFNELTDHDRVLTEDQLNALAKKTPEASTALGQLVAIFEEDHFIDRTDAGWMLRDVSDIPGSVDIWKTLVADHPEHFAAVNAVSRIGGNLSGVINGQLAYQHLRPLDCSFPAMVAQGFGGSQFKQISGVLRKAAVQALSEMAEGQRLRVIEVSNGQPLASIDWLSVLPIDRCDVEFATPNDDAFDFVHQRADRWPSLKLQKIGNATGGLSPQGGAQLVIVRNDFESPIDAQAALDFAFKNLQPGGVLLWLSVPSSRWLELLFGVGTGLNCSQEHWRNQFELNGLTVGEPISFGADSLRSPYALLAKRSDVTQTLLPQSPDGSVWLVLSGSTLKGKALSTQLGQSLSAQGGKVVLANQQLDLCDLASVSALLESTQAEHGKLSGIIHLHGLAPTTEGLDPTALLGLQVQRCAIAATLVKACESTKTTTTCWLITYGAATRWLPGRAANLDHALDAPLYGMARTLLNEPSYLSVRSVDIEPSTAVEMGYSVGEALLKELLAPDTEIEIILTAAGARFVPRLCLAPWDVPQPSAPDQRPVTSRLTFSTPGRLRHLRWEAVPGRSPGADEVVIDVAATGLNFRDVMYALGMLSDEAVESGFAGATLGLECAGVISAVGPAVTGLNVGDRVLAFGPACFANQVTTRASAVARLPKAISFEAAATIPCTFFTAYYAMHYLARLRQGEKILIHGAAGGVGVAAIQIAKHLGAVVFATAGTDEKRDFLRLLGADYIFDSRSLAFADQIMAVTQGQGIDVVLNSLAGEAINRNLSLLKPFGRFLELGKRDFYENTKVGLRPFRNNISYFGIDADQLLQEQPALTQSLFQEVMNLFEQGVLHPLPLRAFEADHVVDAFRHMQQARQIGKVVLTYPREISHVHKPSLAQKPLSLKDDATYLVTGGLGGFGLRTAQWLVSKGARHLVLLSRSGSVATESIEAIAALEAHGVAVLAKACDVTDLAALESVFNQMRASMPPLRGLVHAAAVIDDALIRNTSIEQIEQIFAPKILGARHLHELTSALTLDFFVLYSSATTLFGNPGQGAYVAANAYLETLAHARRSSGLPALCVRWGAIDDVGFLARNPKIKEALQGRMGGATITSSAALDVLERLIVSDRSDLGVLELDWTALSRFLPSAAEPKFSAVSVQDDDSKSAKHKADDIRHLLGELSHEDLVNAFKDLLKTEIGEILRIAPDKIDSDRSLYDIGMDSLMGVELVLAIENRFGISLSVMAISEGPTITKLVEKILEQLVGTEDPAEEVGTGTELSLQVQHLANLHAADLTPQAIAEFASEMDTDGDLAPQRIIK